MAKGGRTDVRERVREREGLSVRERSKRENERMRYTARVRGAMRASQRADNAEERGEGAERRVRRKTSKGRRERASMRDNIQVSETTSNGQSERPDE